MKKGPLKDAEGIQVVRVIWKEWVGVIRLGGDGWQGLCIERVILDECASGKSGFGAWVKRR